MPSKVNAELSSLCQCRQTNVLRNGFSGQPMEDHVKRGTIAQILNMPTFGFVREDQHWPNGADVSPYCQDQRYDKVYDRQHQREDTYDNCSVRHVASSLGEYLTSLPLIDSAPSPNSRFTPSPPLSGGPIRRPSTRLRRRDRGRGWSGRRRGLRLGGPCGGLRQRGGLGWWRPCGRPRRWCSR